MDIFYILILLAILGGFIIGAVGIIAIVIFLIDKLIDSLFKDDL